MKKWQRILLKLIFMAIFTAGAYYTIFIQTQKYESNTIIAVKDLSKSQSISALGALFLPNGPGPSQDSKVLELYIRSQDMYDYLDKDFNLTSYYTSNKIDYIHRLYKNTKIDYIKVTKENLLQKYNDDLSILYDPISATLKISFLHADPKIAQKIVEKSKNVLNGFEQENAKVVLKFLEKQEKKYKKSFMEAIKKLIRYQTKNSTFDPKIDIQAKSQLLANLEAQLIKKEIEYKSLLVKKPKEAPDMKLRYNSIKTLRANIYKLKKQIAGKSKSKLNTKVYAFEYIKSQVDFAKEMYKQILLKVEETKLSVNKNTKNIIVVAKPTLPQSYVSPDKIKQILTYIIVLMLLYGILRLIIFIIKDHID